MPTPRKQVSRSTGRITQPKPRNLDPTSAAEWKADIARPIELPSGKRAILRNPGMPAFLAAGVIPNSLIPIVTEALSQKKPPALEQMQPDMEMVMDMLALSDQVTIACFVEPIVQAMPVWSEQDVAKGLISAELMGTIALSKKESTLLYVDEIDQTDKAFVLQWAVGGTSDLVKFRQQLAGNMDAIQSGPNLASPTKRTARR